ncbi:ABC transporter substrate-binding protein [Verticiella sediminum]|uniref:ABC transporter substrate-binding protein n=1 Tax=Verticiella sediminum TaxID=1247510 RepID=A0A556AXK0_9BURK|nr:ABC transporter substrate-binding protein [Verticiella sediminum]TSH97660.1 ABC transporter substrate-binding protein [Verticiella sediminum]
MKTPWISALLAPLFCMPALAGAAEPVRIGFVTTLSTPAGYLGEDSRDGFALAVKEGDGRLGGVPVQLLVEDDALQPARAKQITDRMLIDGVKVFTGGLFSNVVAAVAPSVAKDALYVSGNSGPSIFAGARCMPNYFATATQNNTSHEVAGRVANELGYKRMVILAANYQGGRDALEGFKSSFAGEVTEIYTKLNQLDYSVELARIRSLSPDAVYQFHTGGSGINFVRQYGSAGLTQQIPMVLTAYGMDERMLDAVGPLAIGSRVISMWSSALDVPASRTFVERFQAEYGRAPTLYAAQAYDTAHIIGSALAATGGRVDDLPALRQAMREPSFESVRGNFAFGNNQHPVQDWHLIEIIDDGQGKPVPRLLRVAAAGAGDAFAQDCKL